MYNVEIEIKCNFNNGIYNYFNLGLNSIPVYGDCLTPRYIGFKNMGEFCIYICLNSCGLTDVMLCYYVLQCVALNVIF